MKLARFAARLTLLCALVLSLSIVTFAVARAAFPSLMASSIWDGSLSGQMTGTLYTNRPFTVTARGVTSTTTYYSATFVSRLQPTFVFSQVSSVVGGYVNNVKLRPGVNAAGYDQPPVITWTVQISSPLQCYTITPTSIITTMIAGQKSISGLNFTALYRSTPATITAQLSSFQKFSLSTSAANNTWFKTQYQLRRSDGITQLSQLAPFGTPVTFTNLLTAPPIDGSCGWTYTVTVHTVEVYGHAVHWRVTPANGVAVTVSNGNTTGNASFQAALYQVFQPVVMKN